MPRPPAFLDAAWYLDAHPDVAAAGLDPRRHYLRHGRREGRRPCALTAADRERDLSYLPDGAASLERLAATGPPAERAWARLALARGHAEAGEWAAAAGVLAPLDADAVLGFGTAGPALLAVEAAVATGDPGRARALLGRARDDLGALPDLALARANLVAAEQGHGRAWTRATAALYARRGLCGVAVAPGEGPAFDRLRPAWPGARPRRGPLVSVVMPARDAAATVGAAVRSILGQGWRDLELILVDNGSTDGTAEAARTAAAGDPRLRVLDGSAEPGAYAARNLGAAAATGAYLTVQDADDWSHPARLQAQVDALRRQPGAWASLSHWVRATPNLRVTRWWGGDGHVHPNVSSLLLRREAFAALGFWDRVRAGADTEMLDRLTAARGPSAVVTACPGLPLAFGRRDPASLSRAGPASVATMRRGARAEYGAAARAWHREGAGLHLPRHPPRRPFPAPPALALGDPEAASTPEARLRAHLLDAEWMLRAYPDLRATGADPAHHYLTKGAALGRDPGPDFSTTGWRLLNGLPLMGEDVPLLRHLDEVRAVLPDLDGALPPPPPGAPRALFVGHQAGPHAFGAERSLLDMLDRAAQAGVVPLVVLPHVLSAEYLAAVRTRARKVFVRPMAWAYGGLDPHPATVAHLVRLIRDWGVAEVHVNTAVLDAPQAAARAAGIPAIVHVRELPAEDAQLCRDLGMTAPEWRARLLKADRLVANSPAVARWLDAASVVVAPNRVDPALFDLRLAPESPPRIALIGSLEPRKGLSDVMALARRFARAGGRGRFVLVGPGSAALDALRPWPANLQHAGPAPDPAAALSQADVVLSLSRFAESFGRTVLEAMAAGRPVVTWDRGTPPDLVGRDGRAGRVVPPGDIDAAARALLDVTAPGALAPLGAEARARARAWDARARDVPAHLIHPCLAPRP